MISDLFCDYSNSIMGSSWYKPDNNLHTNRLDYRTIFNVKMLNQSKKENTKLPRSPKYRLIWISESIHALRSVATRCPL